MSNKAYDRLKNFCLYGIPALATLWLALATIWKIPYGEAIGATITAFGTFMGVIVKILCNEYHKELEEVKRLNGQDGDTK